MIKLPSAESVCEAVLLVGSLGCIVLLFMAWIIDAGRRDVQMMPMYAVGIVLLTLVVDNCLKTLFKRD